MLAWSGAVDAAGLDPRLLEMVRLRASQLNGCGYCVDLHAAGARRHGEEERRIHLVSAWRETSCFTEAERAALNWCEAVTLLAGRGVPEELHAELAEHFGEEEIVALTWAVAAINAWNRLAVAMDQRGGGSPPAGRR